MTPSISTFDDAWQALDPNGRSGIIKVMARHLQGRGCHKEKAELLSLAIIEALPRVESHGPKDAIEQLHRSLDLTFGGLASSDPVTIAELFPLKPGGPGQALVGGLAHCMAKYGVIDLWCWITATNFLQMAKTLETSGLDDALKALS